MELNEFRDTVEIWGRFLTTSIYSSKAPALQAVDMIHNKQF